MTTAVATYAPIANIALQLGVPVTEITALESLLIDGNLAKLSPGQRLLYYRSRVITLRLDPLSQPFAYIRFRPKKGESEGRLTLYTLRGAADQLRAIHGVSIYDLKQTQVGPLFIATAYAKLGPPGRERMDVDQGIVSTANLYPDELAIAQKIAVTQAKRRVTLSLLGLGYFIDESEVAGLKDATFVQVDPQTGEIVDEQPIPPALGGELIHDESPTGIEALPPRPPLTEEQSRTLDGLINSVEECHDRDGAEQLRLGWVKNRSQYPDWAAQLVDAAFQRARKRLPPRSTA